MRRRLRRFLLVGAVVTLVDLCVLLLAEASLDSGWVVADVIAVTVAALFSFVVHRRVTFNDDAYALIDHRLPAFLFAATPSVIADIAMVALLTTAFEVTGAAILGVKVVAWFVAAAVRLVTYRRVLFSAVRSGQRLRPGRRPAPGDVRVSVVLPSYNAGAVVAESIAGVREALDGTAESGGLEIVVVDDGSVDDTIARATVAGADQVVELETNRGKGAAVRAGMLAARGRTIVFTDVDLAYPPDQMPDLIALVEQGWDVVVGSRRHPETRTVRRANALRELGSLGFNLITLFVLLGSYRDTQCGLKAFRSEAAKTIFGQAFIDGFAFDVEVLHLVERCGFSLAEAPVTLSHVDETTVRMLPQAITMLRDVLRVRRASAKGRYSTDSVAIETVGIEVEDREG